MKIPCPAAALALSFAVLPAFADTGDDRTMAMVDKAVQYEKLHGTEKALAAFSDRAGGFVDGELYVFVFDFTGKCLAHGGDAKLVGTNMLDWKSADGKFVFREMIQLAKTQKNGWIDYQFKNPKTGAVEPKTSYIQKIGDHFIGSGTYRAKPTP